MSHGNRPLTEHRDPNPRNQLPRDYTRDVLNSLPLGPFSVERLIEHVRRIRLLPPGVDVRAVLDTLTADGHVLKLGPNIPLWIAATDLTDDAEAVHGSITGR